MCSNSEDKIGLPRIITCPSDALNCPVGLNLLYD